MNEQDPEVGPTHRHGEPKPFEMAIGDSENIDAISEHIGQWIGEPATVFHELISDKVHIDVHIVAPTEEQPYYTLVTSGMSDRAMAAPEEYSDLSYAELYVCLPPTWKMSEADWKAEENYWPIHALKFLARFPHQFDTWLWYGHTIPNGDPPEPLNPSTRFCGFVLLGPHLVPEGFHELQISPKKTIRFFAVVPLYPEEMELKLRKGAEVIENALVAQGYSELIDVKRHSVAPQPGFISRYLGRKR